MIDTSTSNVNPTSLLEATYSSNQNHNGMFTQFKSLDEQAKSFGFYWEDLTGILKQIDSECQEVLTELTANIKLQEELGDLFHAIICCIHYLELDIINELEIYIKQFDMIMARQSY